MSDTTPKILTEANQYKRTISLKWTDCKRFSSWHYSAYGQTNIRINSRMDKYTHIPAGVSQVLLVYIDPHMSLWFVILNNSTIVLYDLSMQSYAWCIMQILRPIYVHKQKLMTINMSSTSIISYCTWLELKYHIYIYHIHIYSRRIQMERCFVS